LRQIAIVAPTASGKTSLSIALAHKIDAVILSMDSISVYKEIDIASAKPTLKERDGIQHFGLDLVYPHEEFCVTDFIAEYKRAFEYAKENSKNLIIVGGSSFYLKALIDGLSKSLKISIQTEELVRTKMRNIDSAYSFLESIDREYASKIEKNDSYRVQKALEIYYESGQTATNYFAQNRKESILESEIELYSINIDKEKHDINILNRTKQMISSGLIDEVIYLDKKYGRSYKSLGSIGIVETFEYLDGKITKSDLIEKIYIHTKQLAKRQRTFNSGQFEKIRDAMQLLS
jgi:tRNA dimethylallyltransferase